jgi:galactonate dehydratase
MRITAVELFPVEPRWLFLKVSTDEGIDGWGEPIIPGRAATVAAAVEEMSDWFIGRDPEHIEDIWQTLYRGGFCRGGPILMAAIAGIDQALWDIKGKRHDMPVYQFLGGPVRDRIRVYAWIGGNTPEECAAEARQRVEQGYTAIKMNGPQDTEFLDFVDTHAAVDKIVARVAAVREAVGPEIGLGVDFHGRARKGMAKVIAKEIEPFHPLFIEEPVLPEHNEALRDIAAHTTIPIATGERMHSRWDFKPLLQASYVDIIQPDVSMAGGISETRRIAAMAEAYDVAVAPHCPFGPIAFAACLQIDSTTLNFTIQEQVLDLHDPAGSPALRYVRDHAPFIMTDGFVALPQGPGLGISIDEEVVREASRQDHRWRIPLCRSEDGTVTEW